MTKRPFDSQPIGELDVYQEQISCASDIMKVFYRNGGPPLLVAQMQQGKTGVIVCVVDQFIKYCEKSKHKYEVIYLTNITDNMLKDQNVERLLVAGLLSRVKVIQHGDLKGGAFVKDSTVDVRLIIIDECHSALEKSTQEEYKPFHEFLKSCGISYGNSIETWKDKNNYVLSVSATPFAHVIQSHLKEKAFEIVPLQLSKNYYSLQQMRDDGRFHQSEAVARNGKITKFFIERMSEFLKSCELNGNGHMVVRAIGINAEALKQYVQTNHKDVDVRIFESAPVNNIGTLDNTLSLKLPRPFVAIIRGSLRAGKTLTTTKHIRMWIEPAKSSTDTMCQAVGRCLGFEIENDDNIRFQDQFPVYCNIKELDLAIEFYNKWHCVPTGIRNSRTDNSRQECEIQILEASSDAEIHAMFEDVYISKCSQNEQNSSADIVLKKQLRGSSKNGKKQRVYYMDGPGPKDEHKKHWEELMEKNKEVIGKYILIIPIGKKNERSYVDKLNDDCIFV